MRVQRQVVSVVAVAIVSIMVLVVLTLLMGVTATAAWVPTTSPQFWPRTPSQLCRQQQPRRQQQQYRRNAPSATSTARTRARTSSSSQLLQLRNSGDIFNNVNVGSMLFKFMNQILHPSPTLLASLASGFDELVVISWYLLLIDRVLKGLYRSSYFLPWKNLDPGDDINERYDRSLVGYLRSPARALGWSLLTLWILDAMIILSRAMDPANKENKLVPKVLSIIIYSNVAGQLLAAIKNWWIEQAMGRVLKSTPSRAQKAFARRSSGILLWSAVYLVCAEVVSMATGLSLNSVISFAGVGGIAFGLASKDLLSNLLGGAFLFLTTPFIERDKISLTNLEQSRVRRIGWYRTSVVGDDEQIKYIPNAQFISNKISNRSRRTHRCLKESFFLTHDVLPTVEDFLADVRAELFRRIPSIDSKSRPFRLYVKRITQTAVEVELEVHFRGNDGTEYRGKRQTALLSIASVVRERGARFAVFSSLLGEKDSLDALQQQKLTRALEDAVKKALGDSQ